MVRQLLFSCAQVLVRAFEYLGPILVFGDQGLPRW